eukprot:TRINITY_DN6181_c0_g1_i3.p1 TRINITY_DN6181_c0_g1~~TRINITY_DN6181_c0_g1_i3.p1  ORF type:complete len:200 (-),score=-16.33 TRINITY_DN6181_c0_g1_i3:367-966(-)
MRVVSQAKGTIYPNTVCISISYRCCQKTIILNLILRTKVFVQLIYKQGMHNIHHELDIKSINTIQNFSKTTKKQNLKTTLYIIYTLLYTSQIFDVVTTTYLYTQTQKYIIKGTTFCLKLIHLVFRTQTVATLRSLHLLQPPSLKEQHVPNNATYLHLIQKDTSTKTRLSYLIPRKHKNYFHFIKYRNPPTQSMSTNTHT